MELQDSKIILISQLKKLRASAERAMMQVPDDIFFSQLGPETNSVAILVKHLAGNIAWRWKLETLFVPDDAKPTRKRDLEFVILPTDTRLQLQTKWNDAWDMMVGALLTLTDEDFEKMIVMRGAPYNTFEFTVMQVIHISQHVGQIIFLAKHFAGDRWQTLTVPKKKVTQP